MSWFPSACLALATVCALTGVTSSFLLTIEPAIARVRQRDNVTIMCSAYVEFSDCQFTWWDVDDVRAGPYFEFGDGRDSDSAYMTTNNSLMDWRLAGYRYKGEGLNSGQCGIQLYGLLLRYRVVGCRVRTIGGSWNYASMTISEVAKDPIALDFAPTSPVVLFGQNLNFLCRTSTPLANCKFRFPGLDVITFSNMTAISGGNRRNNTRNSTTTMSDRNVPQWVPYGKSLQLGQCGVRLLNVTDARNGWVYFDAKTLTGGYDRRVFYMTVARPPVELTMKVFKHNLDEHEVYTATCKVSESRPVANLSWFLDDQLLRRDNLDDSTAENNSESPWRWNHGLYSVSQTLTLQAKIEDDGKVLKCVVDHVALTSSMFAITPISVGGSVTCPALDTHDVALQCERAGRSVECSSPMEVGTVVTMSPECSWNNLLPSGAQYRNITCLSSGLWDRPVLECIPVATYCPAIPPSQYVSVQCRLLGLSVNCSRPADVGTVATMNPRCSGDDLIPRHAKYKNITCLESGAWDKPLLACSRPTVLSTAAPPVSGPRCPALGSIVDVSMECTLGRQPVNCSRPMGVGTVVRMQPQCSQKNLIPSLAQYRTITCLSSGAWDKPALSCNRGCGRSVQNAGWLTGGTGSVSQGEFPWHVGIYKLYNGAYEQFCAGTIISPKLVLTAASCIWRTTRNNQPVNASLFKVAAGKVQRDWNSTEQHVQTRGVASVEVPARYAGIEGAYASNIAVLKLSAPLDVNQYVNAICLDWELTSSKQHKNLEQKQGHVAGWAFTEEDSPAHALQAVQLPYIDFRTCFNHLGYALRRLLSSDHFCAGSTSDYHGYTMCESDQGAGFVLYNEQRRQYFLQGVAGTAFKPITNREVCYPTQIIGFTLVSSFLPFIRENMS